MTKRKHNVLTEENIKAAADLQFEETDSDSGAKSTREYMEALLSKLWSEGEGFSGKRPFGNSGWYLDLFKQFIIAGLIDGEVDEDGYFDYNEDQAYDLVFAVIDYIMYSGVEE